MRFMKSLAALALLATPTVMATTILPDTSVYNPIFQDPYSNNPDLLLGISVLTPCPNSLEVTVNVPVVDGTLETVTGTFGNTLGNNLGEQTVPGSYNNLNAGASISATYGLSTAAGQTSSRWTFRNFQQFAPCTVVPAGWDPTQCYRIVVDVLDDALTTANPGFQITPQGGFVSLNTKAYFQVSQWTDTCNKGPSNPGGSGDPIFSGFQGQNFQFHGLPDEHFNLVSSPDVQLNSHFVYLSSGKCDYNDTECYTHPGTYMDVLGLSVGESHVKLVAGTHEQGLRVWLNDAELHRGAHIKQLAANVTGSLRYHHNGKVDIHTDIMGLEIANSDMFMNIRASLNDQQLLSVGAKKHTVTDKAICKTNSETHNHQAVEQAVSKKYPVTTPLHGLIGQTWRNVKVCGKDWMGTVQDYLVSDLFASDNHYNYFKW